MTALTPIERISGTGVSVRGNDIDTDRIIPARFLRCVTFDGLGEYAFADDRIGEREQGGEHPFDQARFQGASVLAVNANFGCGSSREHAPQAIQRWGIQAIVGVSFAEIFFGNCVALGLPCLTVSSAQAEQLQQLIEADPQLPIDVDVATATITAGQESLQAQIPQGAQRMFLTGHWDATGQLLDGRDAVADVAKRLPYVGGFVGA
ncbi:MAG: 3-isopropylmalate dehydratase small subunit [Planctomycetota bacterium]|nr:MAG: 3-isopropylmalate dehydratase small subunit [Planctomycetota bacterium]